MLALLGSDVLLDNLGKAAKADLTEYLIVVAVVWKMMGRKVAEHFAKIEAGLKSVADEISGLREDVKKDLASHSQQLEDILLIQKNHGDRLSALENKKE